MNIPAGKIIIALFVIIAFVLVFALLPAKSNTIPSPSAPIPEAMPTPTPTPLPTPTLLPTPTPSPGPKYNWEIIDLIYKITEKGENYWYFSWQATVKNNTSSKMEFFVCVNFVDKDGFIIDFDLESLVVNSKEQKSIKGSEMIKAELASDVRRAELGDVTAYIRD